MEINVGQLVDVLFWLSERNEESQLGLGGAMGGKYGRFIDSRTINILIIIINSLRLSK